jgi:hypothetical protein
MVVCKKLLFFEYACSNLYLFECFFMTYVCLCLLMMESSSFCEPLASNSVLGLIRVDWTSFQASS